MSVTRENAEMYINVTRATERVVFVSNGNAVPRDPCECLRQMVPGVPESWLKLYRARIHLTVERLDENDQRIHRIQGQERFATAGGDPWAGVDKSILDRVAAATLKEARAFQSGSG